VSFNFGSIVPIAVSLADACLLIAIMEPTRLGNRHTVLTRLGVNHNEQGRALSRSNKRRPWWCGRRRKKKEVAPPQPKDLALGRRASEGAPQAERGVRRNVRLQLLRLDQTMKHNNSGNRQSLRDWRLSLAGLVESRVFACQLTYPRCRLLVPPILTRGIPVSAISPQFRAPPRPPRR